MSKLAIVVAVAALALGGYAISLTAEKDEQIESLTQANNGLHDQILAMEARLDAGLGDGSAGPLIRTDAPTASSDGTAGTPGGLATRKPATPLQRLAQLEKRVEAQDDQLTQLREKEEKLGAAGGRQRTFSPMNFYGNLDMAAKDLKLDERQRSNFEDEMGRARRELDDLYNLENDNGETLNQLRKPKKVEGTGFSFAFPDMVKIAKFKKGRIPGSNETFGQAEARIRKNAFARMRGFLTPEQGKKWDKAHKEPLLRGAGGASVVFSSVVLDSSSDSK